MSEVEALVEFARGKLEDLLSTSGRILNSSHKTLAPGTLYLLGHNPGGDPVKLAHETIGASLDEMSTSEINEYMDGKWHREGTGRSALQRRVEWLLNELGIAQREVAASNIIFNRSTGSASSDFNKNVERFWPIHERIIELIRPRTILIYSGAGYSFLRKKLSGEAEARCHSGHGNWQCRRFRTSNGMWVVGVPHLSRYNIIGRTAVVDWIRELLAHGRDESFVGEHR